MAVIISGGCLYDYYRLVYVIRKMDINRQRIKSLFHYLVEVLVQMIFLTFSTKTMQTMEKSF